MSVYIKDTAQKPDAVVIWMHGLGADATDMMALAEELSIKEIALRHVFIDAPMRPVTLNGGMVMPAWYDISGMELTDREDSDGISQSEQIIREVIDSQLKDGVKYHQIFLAGFSQGGAMAMYTALNSIARFAGVISLSSYLPLAANLKPSLDLETPFFLASGLYDPLVLPKWTEKSRDWLLAHGYEHMSYHRYPMEHSICFEEIKDISLWISKQVKGAES